MDMIAMIPTWLPGWAAAGGSAGAAFGAVKWVLEFMARRSDVLSERLDGETRFIIKSLRDEFDRVEIRLRHAEEEIVTLRDKLFECEEQHSLAKAEVTRLSAMMQGYGDARNMMQNARALDIIEQRAGAVGEITP